MQAAGAQHNAQEDLDCGGKTYGQRMKISQGFLVVWELHE